MKKSIDICNYLFVTVFFIILIIPMVFFNKEEGAISSIDNRTLVGNPFDEDVELDEYPNLIEAYISDRIGFRNEMIKNYTLANDVLFSEMVHPIYTYGQDGYVFFKMEWPKSYGPFEDSFVGMLVKIQDYCNERKIPFVFVFEPSKISVLQEYLPEGYVYENDWVETFTEKLDYYGINYVDNSIVMQECWDNGIPVFNQKYNAGHWNDMGAYYGMNAVLEYLNTLDGSVHINSMDEFDINQTLRTSLLVSEFPISEYEPIFYLKDESVVNDVTDEYINDIQINEHFPYFIDIINDEREYENAPTALVFQGSYINGMGFKFLENSFSEYVGIHDYQNILNFDYYVNIFQPDCIIFDAAEYTFLDYYFDTDGINSFSLNPILSTFDDFNINTVDCDINETKEGQLVTLSVEVNLQNIDYAYLVSDDRIFDMRKILNEASSGETYEVTIKEEYYDATNIQVVFVSRTDCVKYLS